MCITWTVVTISFSSTRQESELYESEDWSNVTFSAFKALIIFAITPGVSVTYVKDLDDKTTNTIEAAFFLGDLVENLKAAALADITTEKDSDTKIALRAGCAYDIKADDLTITTKGGILFANKAAGKDLEVSVGADLAGLINNTVFSVEYVSGNLSLDEAKKGTVNLKCKMSI